ncbi:hypothetical protein AB5J72_13465 [Streptomyces sp. CG1]|uniref:hypothetical protein n=1 Tax=Streptomyces sp. CG1 TaxID=1287523 RepID=UPI0034E28188
MRRQDVHDELRARLHEAAEAHEPDRARILARVERGMAAPPSRPGHEATRRPVWGWVRVVGTTAAVAGVLAVGGYAVASVVRGNQPARQTVTVSPTPTSSPAATTPPPAHTAAPAPTSGTTRPSRTPGSPRPGTPQSSARPPVAHGDQDGPLWSDGSVDPHSNDFWAQSNLTLKTSTRLTTLTVQLKVAQTGGVATAGSWRSLPESDFTQTAEDEDGFLVYTWTLREGRTVPAGQWVFAGQYNHERGGRDAKDDSYTITGAAEGRSYTVTGDFAAHDGSNGEGGAGAPR